MDYVGLIKGRTQLGNTMNWNFIEAEILLTICPKTLPSWLLESLYDWIVCTLRIAGIGPRPLPANVESLDDSVLAAFPGIAPARYSFSSNGVIAIGAEFEDTAVTLCRCNPSQPPVDDS